MWLKAEINLSRSWWKVSTLSAKSYAKTLPPHLATRLLKPAFFLSNQLMQYLSLDQEYDLKPTVNEPQVRSQQTHLRYFYQAD